MAESFYTILTNVGKAKIANATALGTNVNFTTLKVGDSNGTYYNPTEAQEDLVHTVWQGNINSITTDPDNPNWIFIIVPIPSNVGGFTIREVGIFDDEGYMLAVGKYPETYKPQAADGSTKEITIRTILEVSNSASVTLKIDPTVTFATKEDLDLLKNSIPKNASDIGAIADSQIGVTGGVAKQDDLTTLDDDFESHKADYTTFKNSKGQANGLASLGVDGKLLSSQVPSSQISYIEFKTPGTYNWTVPNNVTKVYVSGKAGDGGSGGGAGGAGINGNFPTNGGNGGNGGTGGITSFGAYLSLIGGAGGAGGGGALGQSGGTGGAGGIGGSDIGFPAGQGGTTNNSTQSAQPGTKGMPGNIRYTSSIDSKLTGIIIDGLSGGGGYGGGYGGNYYGHGGSGGVGVTTGGAGGNGASGIPAQGENSGGAGGAGGAGGGGQISFDVLINVTPGQVIPITVGAGGAAGIAGTGGTSTVSKPGVNGSAGTKGSDGHIIVKW